jgi:predicted dehydrogenase
VRTGEAIILNITLSSFKSSSIITTLKEVEGLHSYEALLEDSEIDVVDIAAPTRVHCEIALAAISRRKQVIVDKPLALNALQAKQMLTAARSALVTHAVTFNYRYNVMVQQARCMISQGALGEVRIVTGSLSAGVAPMAN